MSDTNYIEKIFGADGSQFMRFALKLIEDFEGDSTTYTYMPPTEFDTLMRNDWKSGTKVYWEEMLGRAHLAAAASIIRAYRWSDGMVACYSNSLFLPFCACFRALIESTADTYDALGNVAITLAECRTDVNSALQLMAKHGVLATELEDKLIHFSHARKLSKQEVAPPSHTAKQAAEYIRALEKANLPGLYECYLELCQYTHPAAHSVASLLVPISEDSFLLAPAYDQIRIEALIEKHKSLVLPLLMFAFNPGALVLKVLLHFDTPQFHSQSIRNIDLSGVSGWVRCAKKMGVQS